MSVVEVPKTYKEDYKANYNQILKDATADETPYAKTLEYIAKTVKARNLTPLQEAQMTVNLMSNVTIGITTNAMTAAIELTSRERRSADELKILAVKAEIEEATKLIKIENAKTSQKLKDIQLAFEQIKAGDISFTYTYVKDADGNDTTEILTKVLNAGKGKTQIEAVTEFEMEKKTQLIAGAIDNKNLKTLASVNDMITGFAQGEIIPPAILMQISAEIIKILTPTTVFEVPEDFTLTKLV